MMRGYFYVFFFQQTLLSALCTVVPPFCRLELYEVKWDTFIRSKGGDPCHGHDPSLTPYHDYSLEECREVGTHINLDTTVQDSSVSNSLHFYVWVQWFIYSVFHLNLSSFIQSFSG